MRVARVIIYYNLRQPLISLKSNFIKKSIMAKFKRFEDIESWVIARKLCSDLFILNETGKLKRDFALWDQLNSASGSIMDNIAEGHERGGKKEFIQFLAYAKGSCGEVRSQLYRLFDRKYINETEFKELNEMADHCIRKITSLMNYLHQSEIKGSSFRYS
jgi:four helix bundle protein